MKKLLTEIGAIFTKVLGVASALSPFAGLFSGLLSAIPLSTGARGFVSTAESDIKKLFGIIANVEAVDQAMTGTSGNGPAKLKAAAPQFGVVFESVINDLGLKIADEAAAATAITNITSNMADLLNACKKK